MVSFFFYDKLTEPDLINMINHEFEICSGFVRINKYDKQNTTNEYEEVANMLGYNPETHPMLDYSDSYWYCKFCGEHNFFSNDCDMFRDYFNEGKIKYVNFKKSETNYIYNKEALDIQTYNFNLDNDKIILDGEEIDCLPTPSIHLFINEKLLCYVGMLLYDDGIEPVNFEDINECWKYEPLIINNF